MSDTKLHWQEEFDDNGNSKWVAPSCWEDEGTAFEWRLEQEYYENKVHWIESHEAELLDGEPEAWTDLEEAKAAVQKKHDEHCAAARADAASSG